jgi:hypothetical protein
MRHIEQTLVISCHTAKSHANHIYRKLGVHSREELIGLVESEQRAWRMSDAPQTAAGASVRAAGGCAVEPIADRPYHTPGS